MTVQARAETPVTIDVRDHGAVGDGQADDAAAIQAAIDALPEAGGVVLLPAGDYLIRSGIKIHRSHVTLEGFHATVRWADGAMKGRIIDAIEIRGQPDAKLSQVTVRGLTVDGNYWNQPGSYNPRGIDIDDATDVLIDRVHITRCFVGLTFGKGVNDSEARDCVVSRYHNDGFNASGDGETGSCHDIRFIRCRAENALDESDGGLPGNRDEAWEIEDGTTNVLVQDCVVRNVGGTGFGVRNHGWDHKVATTHTRFVRCRAENVARHGFFARGMDEDVTVSGLTLEDCFSTAPILIHKDVRDLTLTRCEFPAEMELGPVRDAVFTQCRLGRVVLWSYPVEAGDESYQTSLTLDRCILATPISVYGNRDAVTVKD